MVFELDSRFVIRRNDDDRIVFGEDEFTTTRHCWHFGSPFSRLHQAGGVLETERVDFEWIVVGLAAHENALAPPPEED